MEERGLEENCNNILHQIHEKREKMIISAKKHGYTSADTIKCSQELDKLIYEYQLTIHHTEKIEEEIKFPFQEIILVFPVTIAEAKFELSI